MLSPTTLFKCLSDETRLILMLLLKDEEELCVCELMEALQENQPKVSRHLSQLKNCGLLLDRRKDQWVYYRLNPELPSWTLAILHQALQPLNQNLDQFKQNLTQMECRPTRC